MVQCYEKLPMGIIILEGTLLKVKYINRKAIEMFKKLSNLVDKRMDNIGFLEDINKKIYSCKETGKSLYQRNIEVFKNQFCDINISKNEEYVYVCINKISGEEVAKSILSYHNIKDIKTSEIIEQFTKNAIDGLNMPIAIMDYCDFKSMIIDKKFGEDIDILNKTDLVYHPEIWIKIFAKISKESDIIKAKLGINNVINLLNTGDEFSIQPPYRYVDIDGNIRYYRVRIVPYIMNKKLKVFLHGANVTSEVRENMQLEQINKLKDEFFTIVSHEVRTPLNIITSAVQLANGIYKEQITPNISRILESVRLNCDRIYKLVNNIMDLSRADAGILTLNNTEFDLVLESEKIINLARNFSKKKNIKIIFDTNEEEFPVIMDREKYIRILLNILSNAIKYTPCDRRIYVNLNIDKEYFTINIKDQGIGISGKRIEHIFDKYAQLNSTLARDAEGMGLGLAVSKEFAQCMSGEIYVHSIEGEGSEFILKFKHNNSIQYVNKNFIKVDTNINNIVNIEMSDII